MDYLWRHGGVLGANLCGRKNLGQTAILAVAAIKFLEGGEGILAGNNTFLALVVDFVFLAFAIEPGEFGEAIFEWARTAKGERLVGIIRPIVPVEGLAGIEGEGEFLIQIMGGDGIGNRFRANRFTGVAKFKGDTVDDPPAGIDECIRRDEGRGGDALEAPESDAAGNRGFFSWICKLFLRCEEVFRMGCRRLRLARLAVWAAGVVAPEVSV